MSDALAKYAAILNAPHHVSRKHPRLSASQRAAQFMPFAALTGYDAAISEAGRLVDERPELSEDEAAALDRTLADLVAVADEQPAVRLRYFVADEKKQGGRVEDALVNVRRIDVAAGVMYTVAHGEFALADVVEMRCEG